MDWFTPKGPNLLLTFFEPKDKQVICLFYLLLPFRRCKGSKDSCPGLAAKFATCNSVRVNIVVIAVVVVVVCMIA